MKEFYNELRERLQMRANGQVLPDGPSGAELIIPDVIVNRIRERIGDFTTLYPLVDKVIAKGRVKLILDVDTSEATWLEMPCYRQAFSFGRQCLLREDRRY